MTLISENARPATRVHFLVIVLMVPIQLRYPRNQAKTIGTMNADTAIVGPKRFAVRCPFRMQTKLSKIRSPVKKQIETVAISLATSNLESTLYALE